MTIFSIFFVVLVLNISGQLGDNPPLGDDGWSGLVPFLIILTSLLFYYRIVLEITPESLNVKVGFGFIRKKLKFYNMVSCEIEKVAGIKKTQYGIKKIKGGRLYRIKGNTLLKVMMKADGKSKGTIYWFDIKKEDANMFYNMIQNSIPKSNINAPNIGTITS